MDVSAEETSSSVKQCIAAIMTRLGQHVDAAFAVQVALVASCKERQDLVSTLFPPRDARVLTVKVLDECRLSAEQFGAIVRFCTVNSKPRVTELSKADHARGLIESMEGALSCTLEESRQKQHWGNPAVRVAAALALNFEDPQPFVDSCVWTVVRADHRRLEELRRNVESAPAPLFLLTESIEAMSTCFL
jgi:hypothetical protein